MCGIAGFIDLALEDPVGVLRGMNGALRHRGPDASGEWHDAESGVGLAHSRLSILDLSPAGSQPMFSHSARFVTVYNGEIYNYREVRRELERISPRKWRGHSDTEVLLEAVEQWGPLAAAQRMTGMFAAALWDRRERVLHLLRDRIGEKPLYYGLAGRALLFGSELKPLLRHPAWRGEVDRGALALYLRHNCIPAPYSIYRGVSKLPPGTVLSIPAGSPLRGDLPEPKPYWSAREAVRRGAAHPFAGSDAEAVQALDDLLRDAVLRQMQADVPLGAFLSGGVDSSTIVSLMQAQSPRPVRTFTIGFSEKGYDEARYAKEVAAHLGTDHTELYVTPKDAQEVIPALPRLYDEPFSDSSQIPTFLVAQLTRRHVTVSLSGDAGDELFAGYNRYSWGGEIWRRLGWLPPAARGALSGAIRLLPPRRWDALFEGLSPLLPGRLRQRTPGDKLHKLAGVLGARRPIDMYRGFVSHWNDPAAVVPGAQEPPSYLSEERGWAQTEDPVLQMMYLDLVGYLPDDILVKVDRAAMGVSLETRVPLLDHRVVEFAWTLPLALKLREGEGKWILRRVLDRYVPRELIERPKSGFAVPMDSWLRGPLRPWAESLLDARRLRDEGFFNPAAVREKWEAHLKGSANWQHHLWDVLMFQSWLDAAKGEP